MKTAEQKQSKGPFSFFAERFSAFFSQEKRTILQKSKEGVLLFLCAFFLGTGALPFAVYPLGLIYLACTERNKGIVCLGVLCSSFFCQNLTFATIVAAIGIYAVRWCMNFLWAGEGKPILSFRRRTLYSLFLCIFGVCLPGLYRLLAGGFRIYDAKGMLVSLVCALVFGFGFCCLHQDSVFPYQKEVGRGLLVFALLLALGEVTLFGFRASYVLACYATLSVALCYGGAAGGLCGLLFGAVLSFSLAPAYALAGLLVGLLRSFHLPLALGWGSVAAGIYLLYTQSPIALYTVFANALLGGAILCLTFRRLPRPTAQTQACRQVADHLRHEALEERYSALSETFSALSETFYSLSKAMRRPSLHVVRRTCESGMRKYCDTCRGRASCMAGKPCALPHTVEELSRTLLRSGTPFSDSTALPAECPQRQLIMEEIGEQYSRLLQRSMEEDRAELFAADYASVSKLLRQAEEHTERTYAPDLAKTEAVCVEAQRMGLTAKAMAVCGERELCVCAVGISEAQATKAEFWERMERAVGVPLQAPVFSKKEEGEIELRMRRRPLLCTEVAYAGACKGGEEISGDAVRSFASQNGMFYGLLCDGMGSGAEAAGSANLCCVFLEKMLSAGNSRSATMEMLNELLRHNRSEHFSTVDLLEIDLFCKNACFWKSGASPSYVLRGGNLFKIAANTVPVGITRSLQAEEIRFTLQAGDVILMASDGIAPSLEDSLWLLGLISCEWEDSLQAMANKILWRSAEHAKEVGKGAEAEDDRTVLLIRVTEAEKKTD